MKFVIAVALLCVVCSAELGYFWHISDTHMQSDYKVGSDPNKRCWEGKGKAGKFGDYACRSPFVVEHTGTSEIPTLRPDECPNSDPMFVLWTGDSVAQRGGKYSEAVIKFDLKNLTSVLKKLHDTFRGMVPVYPVLGNHDAYPQHQMPGSDSWIYKSVAEYWEPFLPKSALATLKEHGYYSLNIKNDLRLIVLNTVLYYVNNKLTVKEKDPGSQMKWLRSQLEEAKKAGQVVYIAGHIPVRGNGGDFHKQFESPFLEAMKGYHHIIMGSFWGHCHTDTFQLMGNCSNNMDCHVAHLASTMGSDGKRNPSFRRYIVDRSNKYMIKDWRTFYMNLEKANKDGKIKWETLYTASSAYGIANASPKSMHDLTTKMRNDNALAQKVWDHWHGGYPMGTCDATCRKKIVCTILHPTTNGYDKCMK